MIKNVLLIVDTFPPYAAPRMGYLCKYLKKYGWTPFVVCSDGLPLGRYNENLAGNAEAHFIPLKKSNVFSRFADRIRQRYATHPVPFCNERAMQQTAERIVQEKQIQLILTSSFATFPLPIARKVAQKFNLPLIVDLRDIEEQWPLPSFIKRVRRFFYFHYRQFQRNSILRMADAIVSVSEWHVKFLSRFNENANLIFNGYDPELFSPQAPERTQQFILSHTGNFFRLSLRTPEHLFAATRQLEDEGVISPDSYRIRLYCGEQLSPDWQNLANRYQVANYIDVLPYQDNREMPRIMNASSILLLLSNKSATGSRGIMTSKLFEYLGMNRPILLTRSDEDCLEKTIVACNAGCAARTIQETADFIRKQYRHWQEHGYTVGNADMDKVKLYSRDLQAKQFISLFEKAIESHSKNCR